MWRSVIWSWIPPNPSLPSFWRTKKSIRPRSTDFGFSGLFYHLFLSCLNNFFVRRTRYFFFAVPPRGFGFRFGLGTGLISDYQRASAEVNGEKLPELNDAWSLVFTKAGWFTGATSLSSEDRGKSYGRKMFLSQGKRPVARNSLATISPVAARLYAFPNSSPIW